MLEKKAAAEAEAAYKARQTSQQQSVVASGNTSFSAQVQATSTSDDEDSSYTPAPAPTPARQRPTYSSNASSYPTGECTWGAKTLAPWAGDYWGNGAQWATSAAAAGFRTGSTPQVGAIACWNDGGYGHVAVVTAVESSSRIQSIRIKLWWKPYNRKSPWMVQSNYNFFRLRNNTSIQTNEPNKEARFESLFFFTFKLN